MEVDFLRLLIVKNKPTLRCHLKLFLHVDRQFCFFTDAPHFVVKAFIVIVIEALMIGHPFMKLVKLQSVLRGNFTVIKQYSGYLNGK